MLWLNRTKVEVHKRYGRRMDGGEKPHGQVMYVAGEILSTCKDLRSRKFYHRVTAVLPDTVIFRFL